MEGVRWNGEDRSVFAADGKEEEWYEAVREWEGLLREEGNEKWVKLEPGVVVGERRGASSVPSLSLADWALRRQ